MADLEGEGEWSMNCHHEKVSALREMPEVLDGQIHCLSNVMYLASAGCIAS